jgi:hypothetical protein
MGHCAIMNTIAYSKNVAFGRVSGIYVMPAKKLELYHSHPQSTDMKGYVYGRVYNTGRVHNTLSRNLRT